MNRNFVIGDIHGGFLALKQVLREARVSNNDTLIFLGDYVDGWSQAPEVLDLLINLNQTNSCVFLKGNHDQLFLDWLQDKKENINERMWFKHGGKATVDSYKTISKATIDSHIAFLSSLRNYYIDNNQNLFVHAGFTNMKGVGHEYFDKTFYWDRTLWETAISLNPTLVINSNLYPKRFTLYNQIFIGHTPVTFIGETTPQNIACVWNIDTGAAFKGPLTILDVETKEFWQSKPVFELYPLEKGRN